MIPQIKSEFTKLLTVRSTYYILAVCLALTILFAFYIEGFRMTGDVTDPGKLASEVKGAVAAIGLLIALVGALLLTHEYRYNSIMYTLTASNSRLKILLAKFLVVSAFAILATLFFAVLSPLLTYLGLQLKGLDMVEQNLPVLDLLWRSVFHGWAYAMLALIFAFIIRNQVGTIVALLFLPGTVELLLGMLLKNNVVYLPFTALGGVISNSMPGAPTVPPGKSALIVSVYIVVGLILAALLFKKRDAN